VQHAGRPAGPNDAARAVGTWSTAVVGIDGHLTAWRSGGGSGMVCA
jgi:hypothetical protein